MKIFYSWQSDLPNRTNRSLIEAALKRAVRQLKRDGVVEDAARVDRDTQGEPGSPDIGATILRKIEEADVFVADVSIVNEAEGRSFPNPNVLFELGFAMCALGAERVVMVLNSTYGQVDQLPFDLKFKRTLQYELGLEEKPAKARERLQSSLEDALREIREHLDTRETDEQIVELYQELIPDLLRVAIYADQAGERAIEEWRSDFLDILESYGDEFRRLSVTEGARVVGMTKELRSLADALDVVVDHKPSFGDGEEFSAKASAAHELSGAIFERLCSDPDNQIASLEAGVREIQEARLEMEEVANQAFAVRKNTGAASVDRLVSKTSELGYLVLSWSHFQLPGASPEGLASLRQVGRDMHLFEVRNNRSSWTMGSIDDLLHEITDLARHLGAAVDMAFS